MFGNIWSREPYDSSMLDLSALASGPQLPRAAPDPPAANAMLPVRHVLLRRLVTAVKTNENRSHPCAKSAFFTVFVTSGFSVKTRTLSNVVPAVSCILSIEVIHSEHRLASQGFGWNPSNSPGSSGRYSHYGYCVKTRTLSNFVSAVLCILQ